MRLVASDQLPCVCVETYSLILLPRLASIYEKWSLFPELPFIQLCDYGYREGENFLRYKLKWMMGQVRKNVPAIPLVFGFLDCIEPTEGRNPKAKCDRFASSESFYSLAYILFFGSTYTESPEHIPSSLQKKSCLPASRRNGDMIWSISLFRVIVPYQALITALVQAGRY